MSVSGHTIANRPRGGGLSNIHPVAFPKHTHFQPRRGGGSEEESKTKDATHLATVSVTEPQSTRLNLAALEWLAGVRSAAKPLLSRFPILNPRISHKHTGVGSPPGKLSLTSSPVQAQNSSPRDVLRWTFQQLSNRRVQNEPLRGGKGDNP